eukprot:135408_1
MALVIDTDHGEVIDIDNGVKNFFIKNNINMDEIPNIHVLSGITLQHLQEIDAADLTELCISLQLNVGEKIRFKHGIKQLKNTDNNQEEKQNAKINHISGYQVAIFGDTSVGKTSILNKMVKNYFSEYQESTIGAGLMSLRLHINNKCSVGFQMWDMAGQERYLSLGPMYYRGSYAIIIVFDITSRYTFDTRAKYWMNEIENKAIGYDRILLIGNKTDRDDEREVTANEAMSYATAHSAFYIETSAKNGYNIDTVKEWLKKQASHKIANEDDAFGNSDEHTHPFRLDECDLDADSDKPKKKNKCCK